MEDLTRRIETYLYDEELYVEYVDVKDNCFVSISIDWGDWKHEHGRCDYLIQKFCEENNFRFIQGEVDVTEEDGSDCYSAIHHYAILPIR